MTPGGNGALACRPFARNRVGETALLLAAQQGYVNIVGTLVDLGCRRSAATVLGDTALHAAARGGFVTVMQELLLMRGGSAPGVGESPSRPGVGVGGGAPEAWGDKPLPDVSSPDPAASLAGAGPGLRRGIGCDGRGGTCDKLSEAVDVQLVDASGRTPLMVASEGSMKGVPGCSAIVDLLSRVAAASLRKAAPVPTGETVASLSPDAEPMFEAVAEDLDYVYIDEDGVESD